MRQSRIPQVELTPLLDVVFILIFALMLNVNVTKAQDDAKIEEMDAAIEALEIDNQELNELAEQLNKTIDAANDLNSDLVDSLDEATDENVRLTDISSEQSEKLHNQREQMEAFEASLLEMIGKELSDYDGEIDEAFFEDVMQEKILLNEWLKYEQISERYLFVEVRISNIDGRVYINDTYAGIGFQFEDVLNTEIKREKQGELKAFLYDWLDHTEGGYNFVFVTVTAESNVTRAAREMVYDALGEMQPSFDNDQFLINKYTKYQ